MSKEIAAKNGEKKRAAKGKEKNQQTPTIYLFVEHRCEEVSHAIYMIKPPVHMPKDGHLIDSEGFMADSKSSSISPIVTLKDRKHFCPNRAFVNLGSKIYFFGGIFHNIWSSKFEKEKLGRLVMFFDTDNPEHGIQYTSLLNDVKNVPCVFVANGMIYALGSPINGHPRIGPDFKGTGVFECYDPISDRWQVLPDPPIPFTEWHDANLVDFATVVGNRVFIGSYVRATFNLDTHTWDPPPELDARTFRYGARYVKPFPYGARYLKVFPYVKAFHYGARYVKETDSLYQLSGRGTWKERLALISQAVMTTTTL